jgi:DNA (cytosine-5)-methyltransferase 1
MGNGLIYFNEFDAYPAQWLRNLYPSATVDDRSIKDVGAAETIDHLRCHFFAGIGGWEYALQLAGWPAGREVWTGSCPCQPFSIAGKKKGNGDERHLWPEFLRLITERMPSTIFGEQVASADGRGWLAGIRADLEKLGYAFGAADLCAASIGAPHIRQRLFWVANRGNTRWHARTGSEGDKTSQERGGDQPSTSGEVGRLGDCSNEGSQGRRQPRQHPARFQPWANGVFTACADGKARRIESGVLPLAHGVSDRVGKIRAYGNAIVPQVAATFISAFLDAEILEPTHTNV